MIPSPSVAFFDTQFRRQVAEPDQPLNPFETEALPHLGGRVLDIGCGMGALSIALAKRGTSVLALDASPTAVAHLRGLATAQQLAIEAQETDLRTYEITEQFDGIACIGLLMFFDCTTALRQLRSIQAHVRPGGVAAVNVLIEGTTFMDMFDPAGHCLLASGELAERFAGWEILINRELEFPAPNSLMKRFSTVVARKPR